MKQLSVDYHGQGVFKLRRSAPVPPARDEVQIAVAYTGICGTDLKIAHGAMDGRIESPWPIGHEMSGTIAQIGADVETWDVGDKVTVMPLDWCGECSACHAGHTHICHRLNFVGIDSPGSLQERWNVRADLLVPIPTHLDLRDAALVEPVAVAVHDVRRADVVAGDRVVVIGGGPIGLLIAMVARHHGAEVLISEVSRFRLSLASDLGFDVLDPTTDTINDYVTDWTGGAGAEVGFEVSGSASGAKTLTDVLGARGRGVIVAIHPEAPPVDLFQMFWKELHLIGARVYDRSDFTDAVTLLADGTIPADRLITDVMPLEETPAALERLSSGDDVVKLLVAPRP